MYIIYTVIYTQRDMNSTTSATELASKLEFFELTCELLQKEIPKFTRKNIEMAKTAKNMTSTLKSVAANETNPLLKDCLFNLAAKFGSRETSLNVYRTSEEVHNLRYLIYFHSRIDVCFLEHLADVARIRRSSP